MDWKKNLTFGQVELFPHDLNWDFMKWRGFWVSVSLTLTVLSFIVIAVKGINYSIDFTGGVEISMSLKSGTTTREAIEDIAKKAQAGNVEVTTLTSVGKSAGSGFTVRLQREGSADENQTSRRADEIAALAREKFGNGNVDISYTNISGKVGKEEQFKGYMSVLLSLISILVYVGWRFDARFAPGAVFCLFHDVVIALGFMTAIGRPFSNVSIAAFLTIVGYSVGDTIIVYDRIREMGALNPRLPLVDVVNKSINETMSRTVLTQVTVVLSLIVMVIWGGGAIFDFAMTMLIGVIVGSYSSIYVAAPLTLWIDDFLLKRGVTLARSKEPKKVKDPNYIPPVVVRKKNQ